MHRTAAGESKQETHPYEYFDVIAGTGTGGISACMLGRLRMPIDKAISEYATLAKDVFQDTKLTGTTMYKATKLQHALKKMIREATGDEGEMMHESRNDTEIVFAMAQHNLNAGLPVLFRSYTVIANQGPECTISEALHATMAHPDLFKSITIIESSVPQSFVGGELGSSNPMTHVLSEVKRVYPDRQVACIISIGAGHARTIKIPSPSRWHRTQDVMVMKDMATDSERVAEEMVARFEGTNNIYFRFNVDQGMQDMTAGSWEKLGEAIQHTRAYLRKGEVNRKLEAAVRAVTERRGMVSTTHAAGNIPHMVEVTKQLTGLKRCPAPTNFYTGREDEVIQVKACITDDHNKLRVCVIYGLGEAGKTQLALTVIERTWDNWDHIIYVAASSAESIEKTLDEFGKIKSVGQDYRDVINWLESCDERWLMVFDNADTPATNVSTYVPARGRRGSVLITTRLPDLANLADGPGSVCHLSSMTQTDATTLLVKVASSGNQRLSDDDVHAAEELVNDFGCLALAIVHAGAYIAHSRGMTVTEYRSLLSTHRRRMLEEYNKLPDIAKLDRRGDTVYTTWKMCYDQLQPESRELLSLIAYLHYDGISVDIFKRAAQQMHSKKYILPLTDLESQAHQHVEQYLSRFLDSENNWDGISFTGVMADLTSYSLIEFDRVNQTYRVHVLVHDWAKTVVFQPRELAIECTATLLSLSIDRKNDIGSLAFKRQLGLHVTSVLTQSSDIGANHSYYFQEVYSQTGQWSRMMELVQQQLIACRQELGDDDPMTWSVIDELAYAYSELGQWDEALELQTQVLNACKRILGEDHPHTLSSLGNLTTTYAHLGRSNEAEQLQVQVLDAYKRQLGGDHPYTLTSMGSLAITYSQLGRYNEAEQLQFQVLDANKRLLGEDHPDTLGSMNNLALIYSHLGRYNEAKQLQVQVLNAHKRLLGEGHPDTLTSMNNLAITYSHLGQYNEAGQLQLQVLSVHKQLLGGDHPDTLRSMNNLATTYSHLGQYNDAERLVAGVTNARKRLLGEDHPHTLTSMSNLAMTYSQLGRYNEAEQLQVQVLNAYKRQLGEDHPDTLTSMNNLASTYLDLVQYDEAEQLHFHVLDARRRLLGEDHPSTLRSMNNLASTYLDLDRYNEAEQLQVQVLDAYKRQLGEDHPDTLTSMSNLALTYSHLGRYDEAEQLQFQVLNVRRRLLGEEHPDTLNSMGNLATAYSRLGRYNEAEQLHSQVLDARKRLLGEGHPDTLRSMSNLAMTFSRLGRWDEAGQLFREVISVAESTLGDQHPHTQLYRDNLEWLDDQKQ
ncbi:Nephrocystin-3 [Homo sapiens] [Rhizoctonia solani]|uniref:Nephrocystin-3 [Homo sapiens] n=1 Tax=Rhizoctonia solani TaxID=456999 RepID=A0A0K6FQ68_9AGAM|nr:Nephrocystin-3 [Homo sapiens] [Rhizoctonia solani]